MFKNYIRINSLLKSGKTMILVSEVRHVEFTDHLERHVLRCLRRYGNGSCGSKTNEIEAQGLDLHLCIICQRKKKPKSS